MHLNIPGETTFHVSKIVQSVKYISFYIIGKNCVLGFVCEVIISCWYLNGNQIIVANVKSADPCQKLSYNSQMKRINVSIRSRTCLYGHVCL